jgi:hypothetical protein
LDINHIFDSKSSNWGKISFICSMEKYILGKVCLLIQNQKEETDSI